MILRHLEWTVRLDGVALRISRLALCEIPLRCIMLYSSSGLCPAHNDQLIVKWWYGMAFLLRQHYSFHQAKLGSVLTLWSGIWSVYLSIRLNAVNVISLDRCTWKAVYLVGYTLCERMVPTSVWKWQLQFNVLNFKCKNWSYKYSNFIPF